MPGPLVVSFFMPPISEIPEPHGVLPMGIMAKADTSNAPHLAPETFDRAHPTCRKSGLNSYALMKASALGHIRTKTTPFGVQLFNVDDARRLAEQGARG